MQQNEQNLQDNDFKYVMQDTGSVYLGARFTFGELMDQEMVPFKIKAILTHYIFKEVNPDTSLESQFYYMEPGNFLYETFCQLKIRVKVNVLEEKKTLFGKKKTVYVEKIYPLQKFVEINLAKKKASGVIIREIIISKLAMMTFNV
ncbi:MAG: hypothetical protein IJD96_10590 [Lachnospiraceae bacterium]|nr:hypothetical protein [Lachnospiraceae bacterium]